MTDRRTVKAKEVPRLLADLEASGQSVAAFARERRIETWRLYEARQKARRAEAIRGRSGRNDLVPVAVRPPATGVAMELALSSGHVLRIPAGFDEAELRRLLGVLTGC
jgi:hypothetical protein